MTAARIAIRLGRRDGSRTDHATRTGLIDQNKRLLESFGKHVQRRAARELRNAAGRERDVDTFVGVGLGGGG